MALDQAEIIKDLTKAYGFFLKIKAAVENPAGLGVQPPPVAGDKTDEALAVAQSLTPDFIALVREVIGDVKT